MPTGRTYEPIATTTLAVDTADIVFSSIPATYTDLVIQGSMASNDGTFNRGLLVRFNSDTGSNYSGTSLGGEASTVNSARETNTSYLRWSEMDLNRFTSYIMHINNYANTNMHKTTLGRGGAKGILINYAATWRSTAAINAIRIYLTGQSLKAGTTVTLYGIKAA